MATLKFVNNLSYHLNVRPLNHSMDNMILFILRIKYIIYGVCFWAMYTICKGSRNVIHANFQNNTISQCGQYRQLYEVSLLNV